MLKYKDAFAAKGSNITNLFRQPQSTSLPVSLRDCTLYCKTNCCVYSCDVGKGYLFCFCQEDLKKKKNYIHSTKNIYSKSPSPNPYVFMSEVLHVLSSLQRCASSAPSIKTNRVTTPSIVCFRCRPSEALACCAS